MNDEIICVAENYNVPHIHTIAINELLSVTDKQAMQLLGAPQTFQQFFVNERRRWFIYVTAGLLWPVQLTGPGGRGLAAQSTCRLVWEFHVRHRQLSANGDVIVSLYVYVSICVCLFEYWANNHCTLRPSLVLPTCSLVMCLYSVLYSTDVT